MIRSIRLFVLLPALCVAAVCVIPHVEANPLPAGDGEARDFRDLTRMKIAFDRRYMVQAYDLAGTRDPQWNTRAKAYLDAMATRLGGVGSGVSMEDLLRQGAELIEAGCTDPMVAYCHGRNLVMRDQLKEAEPLLRRAALQLPDSTYPACRAYFASLRYASLLAALEKWEEFAEQRILQPELLVRAVSQDEYAPDDQRVLFLHVKNAVSDMRLGDLQALIAALKAEDKPRNPFLHSQLLGDAYRRLAGATIQADVDWNQLLPEDRERAAVLIAEARQHYTTAMAAHVRAPEPAVGLLACALLTEPEPGRSYRALFDAAVAAEFDNRDAYTYMFAALAKHQGAPAVYALARECVATKRFDTAVPEFFISQMLNVPTIPGGPGYDFWRREADVYALTNQALTGLARNKSLPQERAWYLSLHAAFAWRLGQYGEAQTHLDDVGHSLVLSAFTAVNAPPIEAITQAGALGGPVARPLQAAERAATDGQVTKAIGLFRALTDATHIETGLYARRRMQELQWQQSYDSGSPVSLLGGEDMRGWHRYTAGWTAKEDALTVESPAANSLILAGIDAGNRVELQASLDLGRDYAQAPLAAGLVLGYTEEAGPPRSIVCLVESLPFHHVAVYEGDRVLIRRPVTPARRHTLKAKLHNRSLSVWLDGRPVIVDLATRNATSIPAKQVGLMITSVPDAAIPTISAVTVQTSAAAKIEGGADLQLYREGLSAMHRRDRRAAMQAFKTLEESAESVGMQARAAAAYRAVEYLPKMSFSEPTNLATAFPELSRWRVNGGKWSLDDGRLSCQTEPGLNLIACPVAGSGLTLEATIDPRVAHPQMLLVGLRDDAEPLVITIDRGRVYLGWPGIVQRAAEGRLPMDRPITFRVTQQGTTVRVHVGETYLVGLDVQRTIHGHVAFAVVTPESQAISFGQPRFMWLRRP